MNDLIERYLQAVERALPYSRRADIIAEMRSSLYDALEDTPPAQQQEATIALLADMGPPAKVASAYHPAGAYLIGPDLFPTFKTILAIVFCAVIGAQLLAIGLSVALAERGINPLQAMGDILGSLPTALGFVVLVFWGLQRLEIDVDLDGEKEEGFDPTKLPVYDTGDRPISRPGLLFSILISVAFLTFLTQFALRGGFAWVNGQTLWENPVIERYFPLVALSLLVAIVVDIWPLLRGRWTTGMRVVSLGSKLFSLLVLVLLVNGHQAWLADAGLAGLLDIPSTSRLWLEEGQLALLSMWGFRMGFAVAAVVTAIEAVGALVRLVRPYVISPPTLNLTTR
jgi:hypothetical protein